MLRVLRFAFLLLGALVLLWLSTESRDVRLTLLFGSVFSLLAGLRIAFRLGLSRFSPIVLAGIGSLVGLLAPVLAALLMILKIGLHSHPTPDFTLSQVMGVLGRAPYFIVGGLLVGWSIGWFWSLRRSSR